MRSKHSSGGSPSEIIQSPSGQPTRTGEGDHRGVYGSAIGGVEGVGLQARRIVCASGEASRRLQSFG
jgi:hypothetical protein